MPEITPSRYLVTAGWADCPHLSQIQRDNMLRDSAPHLRKARSTGTPALGIGSVYTIDEDQFVIPPFVIPAFWRKGYGFDVGWNRTAAVWGAHDTETDTIYLYAEHYRGQAEASIHAAAIRARGEWIPGNIDPAADGRSQATGESLLDIYRTLGLTLFKADNAVEAGIMDVTERLSTGRLKVFNTLVNWLTEYRIYRRDKHGKIVKAGDHLLDSTRYLLRPSSVERMIVKPVPKIIASGSRVTNPYR